MSSYQNIESSQTINNNKYPEELIIAIQLHFNKQISIQKIEECLERNGNDLLTSLKDIKDNLVSQLTEE